MRTSRTRPAVREPSKGDRTRDQLIATIIALVNDRPLDAIRIADICAPSGLAVGAFYFHFKSRDDAFDQLATAVVVDVFDAALAVPHSADLFSEIVGILSEFYRAALEQRARIKAFFHILNARRHPQVRKAWQTRRMRFVDRLAARIDEAVADGATPVFAASSVTAHFLIGGLERFYDDVFFLTIDDVLPVAAGNFDVFVRQQARLWVRAIGADTTT